MYHYAIFSSQNLNTTNVNQWWFGWLSYGKAYQKVIGNWKNYELHLYILQIIYSGYIAILQSKCIKYVWKAKIYQKEKYFYI